MASKPILSSIPAFDARFGTEGYEHLKAPIFLFSLEYGAYVARENRFEIREYNTNTIVYDNTIVTQELKHEINPYYYKNGGLKNDTKYIARVAVFDEYDTDEDKRSPLYSNEVIFYCYKEPTINFINFKKQEDPNEPPVVESTSVTFAVLYGKSNVLPMNSYHFELLDHYGNVLDKSEVRYNVNPGNILRWAVGGVDETERDENNVIVPDREYKVIFTGECKHGFIVHIEQKFIVSLKISGVGALVIAENVGDGTVAINSNFKIMNAICSTDNPKYLKDKDGNFYAIDLTDGNYVEYIDGFTFEEPYELIVKGEFEVDKLITLRSSDGTEGYIKLNKITYTTVPYYYFSFSIEKEGILYEIRSEYFVYPHDRLIAAILDLRYKDGLYDLFVNINYKGATYVFNDDSQGNLGIYFIDENYILTESNGNVELTSEHVTVSDDDAGNLEINII